MHCPKCGSTLQEIEYRGVRIDQCPGCQGVFLDAGELEQVAQKEPGGFFGTLGRLLR
ncbi:MAG: zf-TFIIB domain-containing protein [Holophagaceae bacterium]|uniref:Zf-TFIIB domain-containing protein n=1 Tax=Candidatus Geothrix skivensis TaxID=2954439 RepID=A0A9D7SGE5_9BACT|nr:zf-TFIIB domain-containing protein [Candidatus Geothrix skivensis]